MHLAQVLIEQLDITLGDVTRRGTVAEDALEGEHVSAVGEEGSGEGVTQYVRGAARPESGALRYATHVLLDAPPRQWLAVLGNE